MPQAIQTEPGGLSRAQHRAKLSDERRLRPRFISIKEAADYLGCSRSHFYAKLYSKVKIVKLGKRTLVNFDSLDELGDSLPAAG